MGAAGEVHESEEQVGQASHGFCEHVHRLHRQNEAEGFNQGVSKFTRRICCKLLFNWRVQIEELRTTISHVYV